MFVECVLVGVFLSVLLSVFVECVIGCVVEKGMKEWDAG